MTDDTNREPPAEREPLLPRAPGYYHVFDGEAWLVAQWLPTTDAYPNEFGWRVSGVRTVFQDRHWDEIDERRIERPAAQPADARGLVASRVLQRILDFDDRNSPEDQPDMLLVTGEELTALIVEEIDRAGQLTPAAQGWRTMESAPKSTSEDVPGGKFVRGVYLLGYCPEEGATPLGCIEVIWWEPNENGGKGAWFGGGFEVKPTHWRPLPAPPSDGGE